jgi:hypothetical protein
MMSTRIKTLSLSMVTVALLWLFVGVERIVDDHEVGTSWQVFVKHRLSTRLIFENPAQQGVELIQYEALTRTDRASFIEYCDVRFGTRNAEQCRMALLGRVP